MGIDCTYACQILEKAYPTQQYQRLTQEPIQQTLHRHIKPADYHLLELLVPLRLGRVS
jgi:hypothetical protein